MDLKIIQSGNQVTVAFTVELTGSMMDMENDIQKALNAVGCGLTSQALHSFDTQGQPLTMGDVKFTVQQKALKVYETPYGSVPIARHVYQTSKGGKTYCPLDDNARIITNSTPRFAQIVSSKYVNGCAAGVQDDLMLSHGRQVARSYVQNLAETVGTLAHAVEETLNYEIPPLEAKVATVGLSLDGTCMYLQKEGYREAMTGTLSLYDTAGDRLHTIYLGAAPEYGKETFLQNLEREIGRVKKKFPNATYVGIADGASSNWKFLEAHTTINILDFYHATEYLGEASEAFGKDPGERKAWLTEACHRLAHHVEGAQILLQEMKERRRILPAHAKATQRIQEKLDKAVTYFTNQLPRMHYKTYQDQKLPIGSGVTEAACKTLIKQRLCHSGMKWKTKGAQIVISLRAIAKTSGRWPQFWDRINKQGLAGVLLA